MNDKIKINLQMAGAAYPLTINREDEEIVREAAKQVNIRINVSGHCRCLQDYKLWWLINLLWRPFS